MHLGPERQAVIGAHLCCPSPTDVFVLEGSARTGVRRVDASERLFLAFPTAFSLVIFILMNAERPCKKARCLSAVSKRSEQLPR